MKSEMHGSGDSNVVPAFLSKLWTLVEDEGTNDLICWDESGKSFHVFDQGRFSKEILPLYFKHNNIASFIRQLNMYGFRKVMNVETGGLKVERDDLEFAHPFFIQDHGYLLENIKRKVSTVNKNEEVKVRHDSYNQVLSDVHSLRGKQDTMNTKLDTLKRENEALWREVANLRQKHMKQQQIVNKLIQFIVTLVGSNKRGIPTGIKRHFPLMINDASQLSSPPKRTKIKQEDDFQQSLQIHDITDQLQGSDTVGDETDCPLGIVSELSPLVEAVASPDGVASEQSAADTPENLEPMGLLMEDAPPSLDDFSKLIGHVDASNNLILTEDSLPSLFPETIDTASSDSTTTPMATSSKPSSSKPPESYAVALNSNKKNLPGDMNEHVDKMQADLDVLKDLLATSTYSLDNSTILSLFNPEGPLPATPENIFSEFGDSPLLGFEQPSTSLGNELISYQPTDTGDFGQLFDLPDMTSSDSLDFTTADLTTPVISPSAASKQVTTEEVD